MRTDLIAGVVLGADEAAERKRRGALKGRRFDLRERMAIV
jgi:hypothetical protein